MAPKKPVQYTLIRWVLAAVELIIILRAIKAATDVKSAPV